AFERIGWPDSAASYLERVTSDPVPYFSEAQLRGVIIPFAHRRLVLLYARVGRLDDARRHWRIVSETFRTPDPEIRPLIDAARAALVTAQGIAKSKRRWRGGLRGCHSCRGTGIMRGAEENAP